MKAVKVALVVVTSLLAVAPARASECDASSCRGQVGTLYVQESGDTYVSLQGGMAGLSCALVSGSYLTLRDSAPHRKDIYALLLSARLSGATVQVRVHDGSSGCAIAYVTLP